MENDLFFFIITSFIFIVGYKAIIYAYRHNQRNGKDRRAGYDRRINNETHYSPQRRHLNDRRNHLERREPIVSFGLW